MITIMSIMVIIILYLLFSDFLPNWENGNAGVGVLLSFKEFLKYYELNPKAYNLRMPDDLRYATGLIARGRISIGFKTPFDTAHYIHWMSSRNKQRRNYEKKLKQNEDTIAYVKMIQEDINALKIKSDNELIAAQETINGILQIER